MPMNKEVKDLIRNFESNIEKGKYYTFSKFYEMFKSCIKSGNVVFEMVEYLMDEVIKGKEETGFNANFLRRYDDEKKNPSSYIYEFTKGDKEIRENSKANAITIWLTSVSVKIDIRFGEFGNKSKVKIYHTVNEMKNDDIAGKYEKRLKNIKEIL